MGAGTKCFLANVEVAVALQVAKQGIEQQRRLAQLPTLVLTEARRAKRVNNRSFYPAAVFKASFESFNMLKRQCPTVFQQKYEQNTSYNNLKILKIF